MVQILPLAAAFVGYIVFWNLSLQLNSVGFYQLSKIFIAPAIIILEAVWFSKLPSRLELAAVALLCIGVTLATVSDSEVSILHTACLGNHHACVCSLPQIQFSSGFQCPEIFKLVCTCRLCMEALSLLLEAFEDSAHHIQALGSGYGHATQSGAGLVWHSQVTANLPGLLMSGLAIWTTSIYQIWAGTKQKEYQVTSFFILCAPLFKACMSLNGLCARAPAYKRQSPQGHTTWDSIPSNTCFRSPDTSTTGSQRSCSRPCAFRAELRCNHAPCLDTLRTADQLLEP